MCAVGRCGAHQAVHLRVTEPTVHMQVHAQQRPGGLQERHAQPGEGADLRLVGRVDDAAAQCDLAEGEFLEREVRGQRVHWSLPRMAWATPASMLSFSTSCTPICFKMLSSAASRLLPLARTPSERMRTWCWRSTA